MACAKGRSVFSSACLSSAWQVILAKYGLLAAKDTDSFEI